MLSWLASVFSMVVTYLIKDYIPKITTWIVNNFTRWKRAFELKQENTENIKKVEESKTDSERRSNVENLINND